MSDTAYELPDLDTLEYFGLLEDAKRTHEDNWADIATYVFPRRSLYEDTKGEHRDVGNDIYDGTAIGANNLLANGLMGYFVSAAYPWYKVGLPWPAAMELPGVPEWLDLVERVIYDDFAKSNWYEECNELFKDLGAIGNATMFAEEEAVHGRTVFVAMHPYEFYWDVDKFGRIDTVYRRFFMSVRQMVERFGYDALSPQTQRLALDKKLTEKIEIIHGCQPREFRDSRIRDARNMRYSSEYWEKAAKHKLRESGFERFPYVPVRWATNSGDTYGWGPGSEALIDIKRANQINKDLLDAGHRSVKPPWAMPEGMRNRFSSKPDARIYMKPGEKKPEPLHSGAEFPMALQDQQWVKERIEDHFLVDFFLMLQRSGDLVKTATEVREMQAEKAAVLGTMIGRLQSEFLDPTIDLMFYNAVTAGRVPPPPLALLQWMVVNGETAGNIKVEYIGPLAQAQKRFHVTQGVIQGLNATLPYAQFRPEILDLYDWDEVIRAIAEAQGMPARLVLDEKAVVSIRLARQKAMQEAAKQQQEMAGAEAYNKMQKAPEAGSPVEKVVQAAAERQPAAGGR